MWFIHKCSLCAKLNKTTNLMRKIIIVKRTTIVEKYYYIVLIITKRPLLHQLMENKTDTIGVIQSQQEKNKRT
jgi:hypothetical protein